MARGVGGLRGGYSGRFPALTKRGKKGDRDGHEGRLSVDREVELLGRTIKSEATYRLAQRFVGFRKDRSGGRRGSGQSLPHAHRLGSLAGEHKRYAVHGLWLVSFGSRPYAEPARLRGRDYPSVPTDHKAADVMYEGYRSLTRARKKKCAGLHGSGEMA
jgi:hypothetical protein